MRARSLTLIIALAILQIRFGSSLSAATNVVDGPSGGYGGVEFADSLPEGIGALSDSSYRISRVTVCAGLYIDSIQFSWKRGLIETAGVKHGGAGGRCSNIVFADDEVIVKISGKYGVFVDSIVIFTNHRNMRFGGRGGTAFFNYTAPPQSSIKALIGRSGDYVDAIGVQTLYQ